MQSWGKLQCSLRSGERRWNDPESKSVDVGSQGIRGRLSVIRGGPALRAAELGISSPDLCLNCPVGSTSFCPQIERKKPPPLTLQSPGVGWEHRVSICRQAPRTGRAKMRSKPRLFSYAKEDTILEDTPTVKQQRRKERT